jgi:REP element-mobilizing transposase RayT
MLYATTLGGEYVLALVFDAEMPFFEIRSQASSLARALMYTPDEWTQEADSRSEVESEVRDVSPPIPEEEWESVEVEARPAEEVFITEDERLEKREPFEEATLKLQGAPPFVETAEAKPTQETQEEELPSYPLPYLAPEEPAKEEAPFVEVSPPPSSQQQDYTLGFACLLIPRMPGHRIDGDLAKRLQDWMVKLHLAFGWRLKQLAITPESLHWLVEAPPDTSPGHIIEVIREHTSQRIFKEFPRLKEDNPSGDFWALSYLQVSGATPLAQAQIQDFIRQTRLRQGVPK